MSNSYTIMIKGSDPSSVLATATVEVEGENARITEVYAEIGESAIIPPQLGTIDFALLVRTASMLLGITEPGSRPDVAVTSPTDEVASPADERSVARSDLVSTPSSADEADKAPAVVMSAPSVRGGRSSKTDVPSDFGVMYWRLGSISKVAKHYDVPHHIAQDWIRLLQQDGRVANPWPRKKMRPSRS